tara:strand:+ start:282 stop:878 length:597 start_codon:yes stop_codon:yes gene_type:complete
MESNYRPIVLIHGLWNTSDIFNSLTKKLDKYSIDYFAPTLQHDFGKVSIIDLTKLLNGLIIKNYGLETEIDLLGFSMGGIIGSYWLKYFEGNKRIRKFISIGSPHKGTLTAQIFPKFPLKGISEMKINSKLLKDLYASNDFLEDINCISFFTNWDLMVFPGWKAYLPKGNKYSLNILKHKNLMKNEYALNEIVKKIIN